MPYLSLSLSACDDVDDDDDDDDDDGGGGGGGDDDDDNYDEDGGCGGGDVNQIQILSCFTQIFFFFHLLLNCLY